MQLRPFSFLSTGFTLFLCFGIAIFLIRFSEEVCEETNCPSLRVSSFFANYPSLKSIKTVYKNGQWVEELVLTREIPAESLSQLTLYVDEIETPYTYNEGTISFQAQESATGTGYLLWYGAKLPSFPIDQGLSLNQLHFSGKVNGLYSFELTGEYPSSAILHQKIKDEWLPLESTNEEGSIQFYLPIKEQAWTLQLSLHERNSSPIEVSMNGKNVSRAPTVKTVDTDENFMFGTTFIIQGTSLAGANLTHPHLTVLSTKENEMLVQISEEASPGELLEFALSNPYGESPLISFKVADLDATVNIQNTAPPITDFSPSSQEQVCDINTVSTCMFWNF